MSESKHTPGPWKIGYGGQDGDDYAVITSPHRVRAICNLEPRDYIRANAVLIAAAPEMLEALCASLNAMTTTFDHGDRRVSIAQARAAIIKATGDAPEGPGQEKAEQEAEAASLLFQAAMSNDYPDNYGSYSAGLQDAAIAYRRAKGLRVVEDEC